MMNLFKLLFRRKKLSVECASVSDRGKVRPDNQDSLLVNRGRGAFCVADGMGGGEGGAEASRIVCAKVAEAVSKRCDFVDRVSRADASVTAANTAIREYASEAGYRQMGSTVAMLLVDLEDGRQALVGTVGDSRIYRYRAGTLQQLTRDHTVAGELGRRTGAARGLADLSGRGTALSHVLTRAVGVIPEVQVEWHRIDVKAGDQYLLCSDGLYDMADDEAIRHAFAVGGSAKEVVARLAEAADAAGATDNYTVIVVKIGGRR